VGPLRVAVDAVPLIDTRTGVGRFVDEITSRLARRPDVRLTAYGWAPGGREAMAAAVPAGVRIARLPMAGPQFRFLWRWVPFPPIEVVTGPVDVVHGPNFVVPPAWRAAELVTVHDLTILRYPELCTPDTLQFPPLLRRSLRRGAWVHTVSEHVAAEVVEILGADPARVVAIPNGVTPVPEGDPAEGHRLAGGDRYVLALGMVEPRKDLPRLVAAFDELAGDDPDLRLVIAGPRGWGAGPLDAAVTTARHRDRIVRTGYVTEHDRAALLRGAAAYAYPSVYEGFGLPPVEAMTAGTPVVATAAGAIPEVVGDAAVLVAPRDAAALAEGLHRVLHDEALADELRRRGTARAARYSWDRTAERLADLYHRVAAARS
jgi:glycosyltransferase involved in cell wall biosynthesis